MFRSMEEIENMFPRTAMLQNERDDDCLLLDGKVCSASISADSLVNASIRATADEADDSVELVHPWLLVTVASGWHVGRFVSV